MIKVQIILATLFCYPLRAEMCPNTSVEKLNSSVSKVVRNLCADPVFKECQAKADSRGCSYKEAFEKELKSLIFPNVECTSLNSFGDLCGVGGGGVAFACRCFPKLESELPFYRFKCNTNSSSALLCSREIPNSVKDLSLEKGEFVDKVNAKCSKLFVASVGSGFLIDSLTYKPNPYLACVEEVLEKNLTSEACSLLAKASGSQKLVNQCWFLNAAKKNDKKLCDSISDVHFNKVCKKLIEDQQYSRCQTAVTDAEIVKCKVIKSTLTEMDYCFEIENKKAADQCYANIAAILRDPYYCLQIKKTYPDISSEVSMSECTEKLAKLLASPRICNQIKNPQKIVQCFKFLGWMPAKPPQNIMRGH